MVLLMTVKRLLKGITNEGMHTLFIRNNHLNVGGIATYLYVINNFMVIHCLGVKVKNYIYIVTTPRHTIC